MSNLKAQDIAIVAAKALAEKKAENIEILKMNQVMVETDFFVICDCPSYIQMRSVAQSVQDELEKNGVTLIRQEGRNDNQWTLLDYGDIVVHIFLNTEREYYGLEKLWADAERIPFEDE